MRKLILAILILLLGSVLAFAQDISKVNEAGLNMCVVSTPEGFAGTGCLLAGKPVIVTAAHIFNQASPRAIIEFAGSSRQYTARLVHRAYNNGKDLAFLELNQQPNRPGVPIAPTVSSPVWYGGYSYKGLRTFMGRITGKFGNSYEVEGTSISGMSGGPVFNEKGELVSVLFARDDMTQQMVMNTNEALRTETQQCYPGLFRRMAQRPIFPRTIFGGQRCPSPGVAGGCQIQYQPERIQFDVVPQPPQIIQRPQPQIQPQQPVYVPQPNPDSVVEYVPRPEDDRSLSWQDLEDIRRLPSIEARVNNNVTKIASLEQRVRALEQNPGNVNYQQITQNVLERMPAPPAGPPGRDGKDGRDGVDGKDATLSQTDINLIAESIARNLPPVRLQVIDTQGRESITEGRLGDTLRLKLFDDRVTQ